MRSTRPLGRRLGGSLTSAEDFQTVYRAGNRYVFAVATVYILPHSGGHVRLGVPAGRRLGSAVARNRVRRRIRAAFGRLRPTIGHGADVVIVPTAAAATAAFNDLVQALAAALKGAGLTHRETELIRPGEAPPAKAL